MTQDCNLEEIQTDGWTNEQKDQWMNEQTDRWTKEHMDGSQIEVRKTSKTSPEKRKEELRKIQENGGNSLNSLNSLAHEQSFTDGNESKLKPYMCQNCSKTFRYYFLVLLILLV